jgi:hypothetical protein
MLSRIGGGQRRWLWQGTHLGARGKDILPLPWQLRIAKPDSLRGQWTKNCTERSEEIFFQNVTLCYAGFGLRLIDYFLPSIF